MKIVNKKLRLGSLVSIVIAGLLIGLYVFSILWRVSFAEVQLFGASKLLPIRVNQNYEPGPCSAATSFKSSYWYNRDGTKCLVWTDKINCFQHVYGSALAAYELGQLPAHLLFCANEFAEYTFDWNGVSREDLLDRRKDLAHNAVGRMLALKAIKKGVKGKVAENYLKLLVLKEMESSSRVYLTYLDPRVAKLPVEADLGCPGLPRKNIFNSIAQAISGKDDSTDSIM